MYTLIVNKIIKYNLIISGFSKTDTLIFRSNEIISIITNLFAISKGLSLVSVPYRMKALKVSIFQKLTPIIDIGTVRFTSLAKLRSKLSIILEIPFSAIISVKARLKILLTILTPLNIVATAIVGKFFKLVEHDPQTLGYLDTFTLRELDFIES